MTVLFSSLWYEIDAALIVLSFLVVLVLSAEIGFRAGYKRKLRASESKSDLVQQGLLTLLAMLLAFGVSMAEIRYEERNSILIDEATSIGTTYLRAAFFPDEFQKKFESLLKQYLDTRIAWYQVRWGQSDLQVIHKKTIQLQNSLWNEAAGLGKEKPTVTMSLLLASLNQTIDLQSRQEFAYARYIPRIVVHLLFLISVLVVGMVGYSHGLTGFRHFAFTSMMSVVLAMTLFVILDLGRPNRGLIRINPQVLIDLKETLVGR